MHVCVRVCLGRSKAGLLYHQAYPSLLTEELRDMVLGDVS